MKVVTRVPRILVFDIEVRPTAWISGDFVGKSMTAAAWMWLDTGEYASVVLNRKMRSVKPILGPLVTAIGDADLVVGHYIRGFDLPIVNADLERVHWDPLPSLLTIDTKSDRLNGSGLSQSLENLIIRYDLHREKIHMSEPFWEEHNCWQTPRSVMRVRERVEGDVLSTAELYTALENAGRLKAPKRWSPTGGTKP